MDIKDIQEQAFERGRIAGRREAIEERLVVLKGVEVKELVAKAETVLEDLYFCMEIRECSACKRYASFDCDSELMRDVYAVIKGLLCGGAEADASATGASRMPRATGAEGTNVLSNCGNCGNLRYRKSCCGLHALFGGMARTACGGAVGWLREDSGEKFREETK